MSLAARLNGIAGLTTGSLFSSGGGWEIGAVRSGMTPLWGIEIEKERCDIWDATFKTGKCIHAGVEDVEENLKKIVPVDILFTSPVCRDYSISQTRVAKKSACRPKLGLYTLDYVEALRPKVVMLENVVGYLSSDEASVYQQIVSGMRALGYDDQEVILRAEDFGNPSDRTRLYAVFTLKGSLRFRIPAIPIFKKEVSWDSVTRHLWPTLPLDAPNNSQLRSIQDLIEANKLPPYPHLLVSQSMRKVNGRNNYVAGPGRPAPTLTLAPGLTSWRISLGPMDTRRITPKVALTLNGFLVQGKFPETYGVGFNRTTLLDIAGDAVSPIMAEVLLNSLRK
jgi:site-specific DNA-cytosine methylase